MTHTSLFPKPLQRQSVPLVCKVFNEKTVYALKTCQEKLSIADAKVSFVDITADWFKMMNVKDNLATIKNVTNVEHHGQKTALVLSSCRIFAT